MAMLTRSFLSLVRDMLCSPEVALPPDMDVNKLGAGVRGLLLRATPEPFNAGSRNAKNGMHALSNNKARPVQESSIRSCWLILSGDGHCAPLEAPKSAPFYRYAGIMVIIFRFFSPPLPVAYRFPFFFVAAGWHASQLVA
jgi:hypothetical protein